MAALVMTSRRTEEQGLQMNDRFARQLAEPLDILLPKRSLAHGPHCAKTLSIICTAPRPKSSCAAANHRPTLIFGDLGQARHGQFEKGSQKTRNITVWLWCKTCTL